MSPIYLVEAGLASPLGDTLALNCAAYNAGISKIAATARLGKNDQPLKLAQVPDALIAATQAPQFQDPRLTRLYALAFHALGNMSLTLKISGLGKIPLVLASAEPLPGYIPPNPVQLLAALDGLCGVTLDLAKSSVLPLGRAGGFAAINQAFTLLQTPGVDAVMVGGIDSYNDNVRLGILDAQDRLLGEGVMDGLVGGEGAGFLLLMAEAGCQKYNVRPLAEIYPPVYLSEKAHYYSAEINRGVIASQCLQQALAQAPAPPVNALYSSITGEGAATREYGVAITRALAKHSPAFSHYHPADAMGDLGAAVGIALIALMTGVKHSLAAGLCIADGPGRSAVVVRVFE